MKMEFKKLSWVAVAFVCGFGVHALFFNLVAGEHRSRRLMVNLNSVAPTISAPVATNIVAVSTHITTNAGAVFYSRVRNVRQDRISLDYVPDHVPAKPFGGSSRYDVLPGMRPRLPHAPQGHSLDLYSR